MRDRLLAHLAGAEEVVLLGDAIELRDRPLDVALAAATPFLRGLGEAVGDGRIVLVPGNHDHRLAHEALDLRRRRSPLGLAETVRPRAAGALGRIRRILGAELLVAYPGLFVREGVWVTHGHYLDVHSAAPTLENAAAALLGAVRGKRGRLRPDDYEALLAPTYHLYFALAQRPGAAPVADRAKHLLRWVETALGTRGPRTGKASPRIARLPGDRFGPVPGELRRPGLRPFARVLEHLGVDAGDVVFGHTHRAGPLAGDDPAAWRTAGGTRLWNTGSWVEEEHACSQWADRPGTMVQLDQAGRLWIDRPGLS